MNKKSFITALLALVATIGLAQTANDYWIAADKALAAGNTDSTFYYLNLFREHFGRQYAAAYTTFLTDEDYRKNFVAYKSRRFNEDFKTAIGHEMGHFWWNKAPTFSWEDWLNEGFAEFSMLWYIKCHFSRHIFDCYLEACRENARHACPIYEVDRDAPEAYKGTNNFLKKPQTEV